jgi:bifunctional DNA-binding transcriptional regulator/antitoxin component of YhaV-PrlF toxin-antitoxin module
MTIPATIRRELGIEGESTLIVDVEDGRLIARPGAVVPAEDAWYYTPEHQARLAKAEADYAVGRVLRIGPDELRRLAGLPARRERKAKARATSVGDA